MVFPELKEIKADRMPMGFYHGKDRTFTNHDIQLEIGDKFYLFTDGFVDQKDILDKTISDWMGSNSQMDDILVVGVRV